MPQPRATIAVDHELHWVVAVPEVCQGAARAPSRAALAGFTDQFEALAQATHEAERFAAVIAYAVQSAVAILGELPALPFVGEPFGGSGGSD